LLRLTASELREVLAAEALELRGVRLDTDVSKLRKARSSELRREPAVFLETREAEVLPEVLEPCTAETLELRGV
jgi:hypothetical protein